MDLSIIIPSYNTKDLTVACVNSIKKSEPKLDYEIVVVDNGSNDKTSEDLFGKFGNDILIITNKINKGFSKACNQGISRSTGKYKLLLNSDTLVQNNSIDALMKFAISSKDAGVVGSQLLNKNKTIQPSCFAFPTITRAMKQYWFGKTGLFDKFYPKSQEPSEVDAVVGASFLITPKALETVGYLDERYFMFFEDLDYCRRVWKKGLKVYYLPASKIIHYHGVSGKNEVESKDQWRRLVPSSKIYHGIVKHTAITFVIWSKTKAELLLKNIRTT